MNVDRVNIKNFKSLKDVDIELSNLTMGKILNLKFIFLTKNEYCFIIFDEPFIFSEKNIQGTMPTTK